MANVNVTWEKIIDGNNPIVKIINLGNGSQFKIVSFLHKIKIFISLVRIGSFFFPAQLTTGDYVSEKLNICIEDSNIIADWINCQLGLYTIQQGCYHIDYIHMSKIIINPIIIVNKNNIIPSNQTEKYGLPKTFYDDH